MRLFDRRLSHRTYCFIVAQGRDGSTLLQALLNSSERCRVHGENILVPALASAVGTFYEKFPNSLLRERVGKRARPGKNHPWFGAATVRLNVVSRALRRIIIREVLPRGSKFQVVGCKEIRWLFFPKSLEGLRILFPEARIIFLLRNSQEMSESGWWRETPGSKPVIEARQELLLRESKHFRHSVWVHYNDLKNGDGARQLLSEFLGVDFSREKWQNTQKLQLSHGAGKPPWEFLSDAITPGGR